MGLDKIGRSGLGRWVTPATWVADKKLNGNKPGLVDAGIWGVGVLGAGLASAVTGLVKARVDDDVQTRFREAISEEPPEYAQYFQPCHHEGYSAEQINAISFAAQGGVVWQHKNGIWVCAKDATGKPLADYQPKSYVKIYKPMLPLVRQSNGKFGFKVVRK